MISAAALLGALAKMMTLGFRSNWRMASMIVTVLPVPGLKYFNVRNLWFRESNKCTYGPKTMKGGDPGGSLTIDDTARFCAGFVSMSGLWVTIASCKIVWGFTWVKSGNWRR